MSSLRESVSLKGYGQRDPLIEYKEEAYLMFSKLLNSIQHNTISTLFKINIEKQVPEHLLKASEPKVMVTNTDDISRVTSGNHTFGGQGAGGAVSATNMPGGAGGGATNPVIVKAGAPGEKIKTVGRNEPCPCGSGKKYKKCHGSA
jgi:preprotein translocase subunit SecA